jgi:predicted Fe-S protein YdhL (DUF1289 family)
MKFTPCAGLCNSAGTHCEGCGRSHDEIRQTLALTTQVAEFMVQWDYENPDDFLDTLTKKASKKLSRLQSAQISSAASALEKLG